MGKYDDTGVVFKNRNRRSDKAPLYTAKINVSEETIRRLMKEYKDDGEAVLRLAMWRSDNDKVEFTLKVEQPFEGRSSGGSSRSRDRDRDRDDEDRRPSSRSRDRYDDQPSRRSSSDDDWEERKRSGGRDDDDLWGDEIPFDGGR